MPFQCIKHYAGPREERAGGKRVREIRCSSYKHGIKLSGYINRLNTIFKKGCPKPLELPVTPGMWISLGFVVVLGITSIYWCKIMIPMVHSLSSPPLLLIPSQMKCPGHLASQKKGSALGGGNHLPISWLEDLKVSALGGHGWFQTQCRRKWEIKRKVPFPPDPATPSLLWRFSKLSGRKEKCWGWSCRWWRVQLSDLRPESRGGRKAKTSEKWIWKDKTLHGVYSKCRPRVTHRLGKTLLQDTRPEEQWPSRRARWTPEASVTPCLAPRAWKQTAQRRKVLQWKPIYSSRR